MLVLSRILYGMLLGIILILVSEICLADHSNTPNTPADQVFVGLETSF